MENTHKKNCSLADAKSIEDFIPYVQSAYGESYGSDKDGNPCYCTDPNHVRDFYRYHVTFIDGSVMANIYDLKVTKILVPGIVAEAFEESGLALKDIPSVFEINGMHWSKTMYFLNWDDAMKGAAKYSDDWRLPTPAEMTAASEAKELHHGFFIKESYWTTEEVHDNTMAIIHRYFSNRQWAEGKRNQYSARFVKEINYDLRNDLIRSLNQIEHTNNMLETNEIQESATPVKTTENCFFTPHGLNIRSVNKPAGMKL